MNSALAKNPETDQWDDWATILRAMIGSRTGVLHFAADVQSTGCGVRFERCRFVAASPTPEDVELAINHLVGWSSRNGMDDDAAQWGNTIRQFINRSET